MRLLLFVRIAVSSTIMVSKRLTPFYASTVTPDVDRAAPEAVIGPDASANRAANNVSELFLQTQIQLIQSDAVVRPVVQKFRLFPKASEAIRASSEAPVALTMLSVTRPPRTYLLKIEFRSPNPKLAADVANEIADSYISTQNLRLQASARQATFMSRQLEEVQARVEQSAAALTQSETDLDVISPKTSLYAVRETAAVKYGMD
jgi:succinoglycan biosynthesis transport protein ExoP